MTDTQKTKNLDIKHTVPPSGDWSDSPQAEPPIPISKAYAIKTNHTIVGRFVVDTRLECLWFDEGMGDLNGMDPSRCAQVPIQDVTGFIDGDIEAMLREVLANPSTSITREIVLGRDVNTRQQDATLNLVPIRSPSGELRSIGAVIAVTTPATQYSAPTEQQNEILVSDRERLSVTLRSIGDGVITTDTNGKVVLLNRMAEEITGYTQHEAIGQRLPDVFRLLHERTRASCADPAAQVLGSGHPVELTEHFVLIRKDGKERSVADSAAPIRDKTGRIIGVVIVFRDTTEKRRLEEELLKAKKLDSIGVLAGGIAHDFNNILTGILGNIELAKIQAHSKDIVVRRLSEAEKAISRAKDLTHQLLTFAKGGVPVKQTATIGDLLRDSAEFALRGSNVCSTFDISQDLWPADIDAGQISQVIHNLVLNACQAMINGGSLHIQANNAFVGERGTVPLPSGRYVRMTFADHGIGIARDNLSRVFDPYFTTKPKGTGLGLATTYSIIKRHEGYIYADSDLGRGTTFYVYLPAASSVMTQPPLVERKEPVSGKGRVLFMDDEQDIRAVAGQMLEYLGYEAHFAADGKEAIAMYSRALEADRPYGVVIVDLTVPGGMGARDVVQRLLALDPQARVVVSSGYSNDAILTEFARYGFRGAVAKPFAVHELSSAMHHVLADLLRDPAPSPSSR